MANNRNERRRRSNQANLEEVLEVDRRVDNMLIDHYAEIIDDILPAEYERNSIRERYRGRYRDVNYRNDNDQTLEGILAAIIFCIQPAILVKIFITVALTGQMNYKDVAVLIFFTIVGVRLNYLLSL